MDDFLLKLKKLSKNDETEKIIALLEGKIKQEPNNIEWMLRLAVEAQHPPLVDTDKSLEMLERALKLEPNNVMAALLAVYIHHYWLFDFDEALLNKITSIKTDNNEEKSMIAYAASLFYQFQGDHAHEKQYLLESVKFYDKHVWNHRNLAQIYLEKNQKTQAEAHLQKALNNVIKIYSNDSDDYDGTDINEFINEGIKGIYLTQCNFEGLRETLKKIQN